MLDKEFFHLCSWILSNNKSRMSLGSFCIMEYVLRGRKGVEDLGRPGYWRSLQECSGGV
jgi:hypothetical protein